MSVDRLQLTKTLEELNNCWKTSKDFAWLGRNDLNSPILQSINVQGLGEIPVPVSQKDLERLKGIAERAPVCKGSEIVVDLAMRNGWLIDAQKIRASSSPPDAFGRTVPELVWRAMHQLGLDAAAVGLDIHLYKLLLYETGGHFVKHLGTSKEPGMFASLVVQIPVEGGHLGGAHHVEHGGQRRVFDTSVDSQLVFYSSVCYANCQRQLMPITAGWQLHLTFNLVWKQSVAIPADPEPVLTFVTVVRSVQKALASWMNQSDGPRLLAFPLKHKYESKYRPLACWLKGWDRHVLDVLRVTGYLELHLAVITKHQTGSSSSSDQDDSCEPPMKRRRMTRVDSQVWETAHWRALDGRSVSFPQLHVDCSTEMVGDVDQVFHDDAEPDHEASFVAAGADASQPPSVFARWFRRSVLIVWPKHRSIDLACHYGFDAALDLIERALQAGELTRRQAVQQLQCVLNFCRTRPERVWFDQLDLFAQRTSGPGVRLCRLIRLCTVLQARDQGLDLLRLMGDDLAKEAAVELPDTGRFINRPRNDTFYEGVQSEAAAEAVAEFVDSAGFDVCRESLERIVCVARCAVQIGGFASLTIHLLKRRCMDAAVVVGQRTVAFLTSTELRLLGKIDLDSAVCCVLMVLRLEQHEAAADEQRVPTVSVAAKMLGVKILAHLVVYLWQRYPSDVKSTPSTLALFKGFWADLMERDWNGPEATVGDTVIDLMRSLLWLDDAPLMDAFVGKLCHQWPMSTGNNASLQTLTGCFELRADCAATPTGRDALRRLIEARIAELRRLHEPVYTLHQSAAVFSVDHPSVEAFLRSGDVSMVYTARFNSLQQARSFGEKHFGDDSVLCGYSADVEAFGAGKAAKCRITKNNRLHQHLIDVYDQHRIELVKLEYRLQKWTSPDLPVIAATASTPADDAFLPDEEFQSDEKSYGDPESPSRRADTPSEDETPSKDGPDLFKKSEDYVEPSRGPDTHFPLARINSRDPRLRRRNAIPPATSCELPLTNPQLSSAERLESAEHDQSYGDPYNRDAPRDDETSLRDPQLLSGNSKGDLNQNDKYPPEDSDAQLIIHPDALPSFNCNDEEVHSKDSKFHTENPKHRLIDDEISVIDLDCGATGSEMPSNFSIETGNGLEDEHDNLYGDSDGQTSLQDSIDFSKKFLIESDAHCRLPYKDTEASEVIHADDFYFGKILSIDSNVNSNHSVRYVTECENPKCELNRGVVTCSHEAASKAPRVRSKNTICPEMDQEFHSIESKMSLSCSIADDAPSIDDREEGELDLDDPPNDTHISSNEEISLKNSDRNNLTFDDTNRSKNFVLPSIDCETASPSRQVNLVEPKISTSGSISYEDDLEEGELEIDSDDPSQESTSVSFYSVAPPRNSDHSSVNFEGKRTDWTRINSPNIDETVLEDGELHCNCKDSSRTPIEIFLRTESPLEDLDAGTKLTPSIKVRTVIFCENDMERKDLEVLSENLPAASKDDEIASQDPNFSIKQLNFLSSDRVLSQNSEHSSEFLEDTEAKGHDEGPACHSRTLRANLEDPTCDSTIFDSEFKPARVRAPPAGETPTVSNPVTFLEVADTELGAASSETAEVSLVYGSTTIPKTTASESARTRGEHEEDERGQAGSPGTDAKVYNVRTSSPVVGLVVQFRTQSRPETEDDADSVLRMAKRRKINC